MHLALTDRMICPRCGPGFGLILLAHEVRDRRILEGDLGCPNCREQYPVRKGFADLRPPPREPISLPPSGDGPALPKAEETLRLGALLGVTEGPATLLIRGPAAGYSESLTALIGGIEVVGVESGLAEHEETEGVSRMVAHPRLPFLSNTFRGVLLSGEYRWSDIEEGARVLTQGGRLVLIEGTLEDRQRLSRLEFEVLLEEAGTFVTRKEGPGSPPLVTLRGL